MAILSFANDTTSDIFHGHDTKAARRVPKNVWPAARRKMTILHNAKSTLDLTAIPGNRFESLKMILPDYSSMRVNDNYRLLFIFKNGDAYNVSIENYHGRTTQ